MPTKPSVAYILEPRFPGGTSSAVATELRATATMARVSVNAIRSKMFKGDNIAPPLEAALRDLGLKMVWDPQTISADIVILHNPSFLKFQSRLGTQIIARHLIVVTHENFLRPGAVEAFDVAACLEQIDRGSIALQKSIVPVSQYNRSTVEDWLLRHRASGNWSLLDVDWFNICSFSFMQPNHFPEDRRGRHSRAGFEKFPSIEDLDICFPKHAQSNIIIGADTFMKEKLNRPHWKMIPFRGIDIDKYFEMIDFMVYFTSSTWRESFGRVVAEAIAAGKVVITDPGTASTFSGAAIPASPSEIDGIIQAFISDPPRYSEYVRKAQETLLAFSADVFQRRFSGFLQSLPGARS